MSHPYTLSDRLRTYATAHDMEFASSEHRFELAWEFDGLRRFIEIDLDSHVVRAGLFWDNEHLNYSGRPRLLGSTPLDELLEAQRRAANAGVKQ